MPSASRSIAVRLLFALLALACAPLRAAGVEATDDRGVTVRWDAPPRRIVSLLPSLTESLCALGQCARLVGVDRYADWPAEVARLPRLGGGLDPSIEAIVALRPDAVLLAQSSRVVARLESLGLKVLALEPRTQADVRRTLATLARLSGLDEAAGRRAWDRIEAGVEAAARSVPPTARGAKVYFEVSAAPYAAAPPSFIGETLARLGLRNVVPEGLGPFPQVNPEFVVRADPDLVMVFSRDAQGLAQRPGWSAMRALRAGRVCTFDAAQAGLIGRPGPRMDEAARLMARCIQDKLGSAAK